MQRSAQPAREHWHRAVPARQRLSRVPRKGCWVLAAPQHLVRLPHHKVFDTAQFQRQHRLLRKAAGKAGGTATDTPDPRLGATQLKELLEPRTLPNAAALGRGLLSSQSQGNLGESGEHRSLPSNWFCDSSAPRLSLLYTSICLLKIHWRAAKLRQNLCVGLKKPPALCYSIASSSLLVEMNAGLPTASQRDESSSPGPRSPPAHPHRPGSPTPASQRGTGIIWLHLYFTLSPPLCGGGLCLSRVTYTDMPFLKDFFFLL